MKKLIPFLCVFAYFASPYRIAGHELPAVICIISLVLALLSKPIVSIDKKYLTYMIYMWVVPLVCAILCSIPGDYMTAAIPVALILTSCYLFILLPTADKNLVLKYYRLLVYIAVGFFIVQEISFYLFSYRPTLYLSFLEMYYEDSDAVSFSASRAGMERSSSFFLEPSHFVQYIMPYYCILLSKFLETRKNLLEVLAFTSVIIFIRSGVGLVVLLVLFCFFFMKSNYLKLYQKVLILVFGLASILLVTVLFADTELVSSLMGRSSEITSLEVEAHGAQSGFIRIWRGYFIYGAMDTINQILGVSIACIEHVCNAVYIPGVRYDGGYMNGIQSLLVTGGIIGFLLFFRYLFGLAKRLDITGKSILVAMIALFFMEQMLNTDKMFLYILLASCFVKNNIVQSYSK